MFDYRLKVFDAVARRLSFTKAAEELCISQPAVTKHIKELEKQFRMQLFERKGNGVALTEGGLLILKHTGLLREITRQLEYEIHRLHDAHQGLLKLGASTTVAQYVLPPLLAKFHRVYHDVNLQMLTANTEQVEQALIGNKIELGIIEGDSKRKDIIYTPLADDDIVLVSGAKNPRAKKEEIRIEDLVAIPLLLREPGSGTLEVITHALKSSNLRIADLAVEMYLGSSEAIKSYLLHSQCMAFISRHAIMHEVANGLLKVVTIRKFSIRRRFFFITLEGQIGGLPEVFMRFASDHYSDLLPAPF